MYNVLGRPLYFTLPQDCWGPQKLNHQIVKVPMYLPIFGDFRILQMHLCHFSLLFSMLLILEVPNLSNCFITGWFPTTTLVISKRTGSTQYIPAKHFNLVVLFFLCIWFNFTLAILGKWLHSLSQFIQLIALIPVMLQYNRAHCSITWIPLLSTSWFPFSI